MPLRLINLNEPKIFVIEDTAIGIKPMTNGQKMTLASEIANLSADPAMYSKLMALIANHIDSIEGRRAPDIDIADTLSRIEDITTQQAIIDKVMSISGLDELQSKNSESSSGISTDSAGLSNTEGNA